MKFEKDKDYKFSFAKYRIDCAKNKVPMGPWAQIVDGARVILKDDLTEGALHVYVKDPSSVIILHGVPVGNRVEEGYFVLPEWCEER